ncbi:MAG TPA: CBS domain-containing protein [Longimicrobiales bacterium]|nr:CBS domain-containing protein [Longimicrobiales bacterium]
MNLLDLLRPEHVLIPLRANGLRNGIEQLMDRLEASGAVDASEPLRKRVRTEPLRDMVAISDDVVLPHYRSEAVHTLTLALGISPERIIPLESGLEARPRVIALILAPQEAASLYLQTTSTLARLLRRSDIVDRLVAQPDAAAVLALPEIRDLRVQPSLSVRDVMVHRVRTVAPDASVRSVLDLMLRRRLHAVPVVGDKEEVLGLVTDGDLMRALLPHIPRAGSEGGEGGEVPLMRPVRDIMTRSVLCVSEDLGVSEVASMMINKDVDQVPVVQAGAITGMVARADIIRKLFGRA